MPKDRPTWWRTDDNFRGRVKTTVLLSAVRGPKFTKFWEHVGTLRSFQCCFSIVYYDVPCQLLWLPVLANISASDMSRSANQQYDRKYQQPSKLSSLLMSEQQCDFCFDLFLALVFTARRYASAVLAVIVCLSVRPSVCPSVTSRSCTKMAKPRIRLTTPYDSPETLVLRCQKSWRNSDDITPNGGAK